MRNRLTRWLGLLCCWAVCAAALAQHPLLHNYAPADYGGGTQNWCVAQSRDGRMMFGNNYGLLDFDGRRWSLLYMPNYTAVRALCYDEQRRRVYVGATGEFGYFAVDSTTGRFDYHSLSDKLPKAQRFSDEIWNAFLCGDRIVMQSKERFYLISSDDRVVTADVPGRIEASTAMDRRIVAVTDRGLWTLVPGARPQAVAQGSVLEGKTVRQMVRMDDRLIFATARHGLFSWRMGAPAIEELSLDITPYLLECQVFCAQAKGSRLVLGTVSGGVVVKDFSTGQTTYANTRMGLKVNTVLSVGFDNNDNLWMGLDNGIAHMIAHTCGVGLTMSGGIGTGYCSMREKDVLYLGTNQGLYTLHYPMTASPTPAVPTLVPGMIGQTWRLVRAYGVLFACTDNGIFQMSNGSPQRIEDTDGGWNVVELPGSDDRELLLACDYQGFLVLQREGSRFRVRNRLKDIDLVSGDFGIDSDGTLWVAHWQKGVYRLRFNDDFTAVTQTQHFGPENGLATNEGNSLAHIGGRYYISAVGGLFSYNTKTRALERAESLQHLFKVWDPAPKLVETPSGDIFAINKDYFALARHQKDGSYEVDETSFSELAHGLQFGMGAFGFADDHHTILNTNDGFILVDHDYHATPHTNTLIVRSITDTKDGEVLYSLLDGIGEEANRVLKFDHRHNSLRIEFVLPEYGHPRNIVYQCCLDGYDSQWSEERAENIKEYTKLPKGRYTFRVKARNILTGEVLEMSQKMEILPAWYETWWAYLVYFFLLCATMYGGFRAYRLHTQRKYQERLLEQERQQREEHHRLEAENARQEREVVQLRNEQLELELKHRSSKLADSTTNLIRKNDFLLDIDERLKEMAAQLSSDPTTGPSQALRRIAELRRVLKANISDDDNWDKFEQSFNLVYDNFMVRLTERYPTLKTSDKRICAYLRMGLSSKEMATLMNTVVRSIETARYRLRKKLELESGENLVDFLQRF